MYRKAGWVHSVVPREFPGASRDISVLYLTATVRCKELTLAVEFPLSVVLIH